MSTTQRPPRPLRRMPTANQTYVGMHDNTQHWGICAVVEERNILNTDRKRSNHKPIFVVSFIDDLQTASLKHFKFLYINNANINNLSQTTSGARDFDVLGGDRGKFPLLSLSFFRPWVHDSRTKIIWTVFSYLQYEQTYDAVVNLFSIVFSLFQKHWRPSVPVLSRMISIPLNKKAVRSQWNRAMPQLLFLV